MVFPALSFHGRRMRLTEELIGSDFRIYEKGIEVDKSRELRGSSFQVSVINERTALHDEYIEALRYEFTLPLPNNRRWDLDKEILPVLKNCDYGSTKRK